MTSDATSAATSDASEIEKLRELIASVRFVLWDFDGPICRLFARHRAERVAADLVGWLERQGPRELLTDAERVSPDPQVVLRAVGRRSPDSGLVAGLEEQLTQQELRAAASALPTAYADPLIRTWTAVGARLAVTTDNSPQAAGAYLEARGLTRCFATHLYGRTRQLDHLKPHPQCLIRALDAMGATASTALMIGDSGSDVAAAREAGVPFLGYACAESREERLRAAGAEHVVRSLEPLLRVLRSGRPVG
ncbi:MULTISPECIES: HAD family hydrolase [Streptomyces]|uniref:HAD family hydrolase n=1 Tax=Streptomyces TaxID=1883 RepID=UPI000AB3681E|nr:MULTISPECIES: HAD family hydrolase [Streptomyces]